jgi:hypothetical protein
LPESDDADEDDFFSPLPAADFSEDDFSEDDFSEDDSLLAAGRLSVL